MCYDYGEINEEGLIILHSNNNNLICCFRILINKESIVIKEWPATEIIIGITSISTCKEYVAVSDANSNTINVYTIDYITGIYKYHINIY